MLHLAFVFVVVLILLCYTYCALCKDNWALRKIMVHWRDLAKSTKNCKSRKHDPQGINGQIGWFSIEKAEMSQHLRG